MSFNIENDSYILAFFFSIIILSFTVVKNEYLIDELIIHQFLFLEHIQYRII